AETAVAASPRAPIPRAPINVKAVSFISVSSAELHAANDTGPASNPCPPRIFLSATRLFDCGIELGAGEHDERAEVEPHQEDHHRGQRAVGLVVGSKALDVERETGGADQPQQRGGDGAGVVPVPARGLSLRSKAIEETERDEHDPGENRPTDQGEGIAPRGRYRQ